VAGVLRLPQLLGEQMNTHIEDVNLMTFGRKTFDVSNVAVKKTMAALEKFNKAVIEVQNDRMTSEQFNFVMDNIGVDFIKHEYRTLRIRFNPLRSIIEVIKRYFFTIKDVQSLNKESYDMFHDWVYYQTTGRKKKDLEAKKEIMEITTDLYQKAKKELNLDPEKCSELLMTYLKDQTKQ